MWIQRLARNIFNVSIFIFPLVAYSVEEAFPSDEDDIRERISSELGLRKIPEMIQSNISSMELQQKLGVYREKLRQTEKVRMIQKHLQNNNNPTYKTYKFTFKNLERNATPIISSKQQIKLQIPSLERPELTGPLLVTSATVTLHVKKNLMKRGTIYMDQLLNDNEHVQIGFDEVDEDFAIIDLDVTDTVQSWVAEPNTNKGLQITLENIITYANETTVSIETKAGPTRFKRSFYKGFPFQRPNNLENDCSATNYKCCRANMEVDLRRLKGFEFIVEPKVFNAYMCRGSCPLRYHPLSEHSLLQSLMHPQKGEALARRPCCIPSQLSSIPILHLDEKNTNRLKVTMWKNVIVTQCACG